MRRSRPLLILLLSLAWPLSGANAATLPLSSVAEYRLPPTAVAAGIEAGKSDPLRFAATVPVNLDTDDGSWDEPSPGLSRWRLRIRSDDALSLSLRLDALQVPETVRVQFATSDGRDLQQPALTADTNELWLPLVRSDEAVLTLEIPSADRDHLALRIIEVQHGFRLFSDMAAADAKGAFGNSGSCNNNVATPTGNGWRPQIRSVALLTLNNAFVCTGTLVNNTRGDGRPLVLTANHCEIRSDNIGTVRAYFNVQKIGCSSANGRVNQNLAANQFLARDQESDFTLFTLASTPPASFNVFYAGWDARGGIAPTSGAAIHHPRGDDKKISLYNRTAIAVENAPIGSAAQRFEVDAWEVRWSSGTTEPGSSGSALWNQAGRIVGVLSGGDASCAAQGSPDYFARLDRGWLANPSSNGQLKAHLAPDSDILILDGLDLGNDTGLAICEPSSSEGGGALTFASLALLLMALQRRHSQRR